MCILQHYSPLRVHATYFTPFFFNFFPIFQFLLQYGHFQANLKLFQLEPHQESKPIQDLVMFLSQVSHHVQSDLTYPHTSILHEVAYVVRELDK